MWLQTLCVYALWPSGFGFANTVIIIIITMIIKIKIKIVIIITVIIVIIVIVIIMFVTCSNVCRWLAQLLVHRDGCEDNRRLACLGPGSLIEVSEVMGRG